MPEPLILGILALAGGIGAAVRYLADTLAQERLGVHPALAVGCVNAVGSLVFGLCAGHLDTLAGILGAGFAGGFTTFSTAMLQVVTLARTRGLLAAAAALFGTFAVCVPLAILGSILNP